MPLRKLVCMPQSSHLQNMDNDYTLKGFDAQIKTDMKVQLLSVTSQLALLNIFILRIKPTVPNIWKNDQNVVENAFLA